MPRMYCSLKAYCTMCFDLLKLIPYEKGDMATESYSILARWKNHFLCYCPYMGLMMLGRQEYIQQNH